LTLPKSEDFGMPDLADRLQAGYGHRDVLPSRIARRAAVKYIIYYRV
jgi:hypothetical protein